MTQAITTHRRIRPEWLAMIERELAKVSHPGKTVITIDHGRGGGPVDCAIQLPPARASLVEPGGEEKP